MEAISGFFGEYRWLSNFWRTPVRYNGTEWKSSEHAYQAAKFIGSDENIYHHILTASSPGEAKRLGRLGKLRKDWEDVKYQTMLDITREKYTNYQLRQQLLATGDLYLEEENPWNDTYWGTTKGVGQNNLGKILMQVRKEIQEYNDTY